MKTRAKEEIEKKVRELWASDKLDDFLNEGTLQVEIEPNKVSITLAQMYEPPGLSFAQLMSLAEFFGTKNINDDDRFGEAGCETCDYGSSYGFTLTIRPEKE